MKIKNQSKRNYQYSLSWIPRTLMIIFIVFITGYTYMVFSSDSQRYLTITDILFYFLPSMIMLGVLRIGWEHEKVGGILVLLASFVFLAIYHVHLSTTVFFFLIITGALFLTNDYRVNRSSG